MPSSTASTPGRSGANLLKVGKDVALYGWTYARILESFQPVGKGVQLKVRVRWGDPSVEVFTDSHPSSVLGEWTKASKSYK